ncbi:MAG: SpoIIE family protein phosphatase [Terriglobales bacterium]
MAGAAQRFFRRQFYTYWPQMSRVARVAAYFAAVDLLLLLVWGIMALVRPGGSAGMLGWVRFVSIITAFLLAWLAGRWLRKKVMWRLRNRLIVTYVFIGVIPVLLLVCIGLIAAYLFAWQFATYVASSDFHAEITALGALNNRYAFAVADRLSRGGRGGEQLLRESRGRESLFPDREITCWYRGQAFSLRTKGSIAALPPGDAKEFRGFAIDGGRLLLRAVDTVPAGNDSVVLISSVPLNTELLGRIGSALGEVSVEMFTSESNPNPRKGKDRGARLAGGNEALSMSAPETGEQTTAIKAGQLPPPVNRFDREITGGSLLEVMDWQTGKNRTALLAVVTRPSLLYDRLFRTVGPSVSFIIGVLVVVVVVFGIIELLALVIGMRLTRTMTRSVAALYQATQHVNRGDFGHRIEVRSDDQLAALEGSFNSMTSSLERLLLEQKEKQRLENELVIAQEVQAQLFPRALAELPGLELHGTCRPARTVSGDYYDFLPLETDKVALAVGDVSGKGISAALLMATINSAVRAYSLETALAPAMTGAARGRRERGQGSLAFSNGDLSPSALMSLLNRQLYRSTPLEKYATLFFGTYHAGSRMLSYCNAGHLPPLVLKEDGSILRLDCGGLVVGLFDDVPFEEAQVKLAPGDIFIAYSDGMTEPENDFGEFGESRLLELVRENRHLPLERIAELALAAVLEWIGGAEQPDDMTIVLARAR